MSVLRPMALLAFGLLIGFSARAEQVQVPLSVGLPFVEERIAAELGMDAAGQARLRQDACNHATLSDLDLESEGGRLVVSMAARATVGTRALDHCLGPGEWSGRLLVTLSPRVSGDGLGVVLRPESAELRRADGSEGLFTRPARALAESLVLPRLGQVRIDLREPLTALDELLVELTRSGEVSALVGRARLETVAVVDDGVEASLVFQVEPPPERPPEPPLEEEELAQWQRLEDELDGFLTVVVLSLSAGVEDPALQRDLLAVLLDSRHAIAEALARDEPDDVPDPVRTLFADSWDRLRPHLETLDQAGLVPDGNLRMAGFIAGGDAIRALNALGPEYGLEVTRDGLRRLARLLLADDAPASFTPLPLEIDPRLRRLFPPTRDTADPAPDAGARNPGSRMLVWLIRDAAADSALSPAEALRGRVARLSELDEYLELVSALLGGEVRRRVGGGTRIPGVFRHMIDPLLRATAWKESCWRQYTGSADNPRVLTSSVGALGMMQVHARVWRGMYDVDRLADDVAYNVSAGTDILEYYFVDYALRREEQKHEGGMTNLVRATYAAYNGGPRHLTRYRRDDTSASLRAIDRDFWHHYQVMRRDKWPDVASCYPVN